MRWQDREGSSNVEDRRGMKGPAMIGGGSILILIIGVVFALLRGAPPQQIIADVGQQLQQQQARANR